YEPNGYGLYDMVGNVWEWVDDGEKEDDAHHVVGGSWVDGPRKTKCTVKNPVFDALQRVINYGLRCVRSLTEEDLSRLAEEEAEKLRQVKAAARREAATKQAALRAKEAARKAKSDAEAKKVLDQEEAERQAVEAEKAKKAEAFARIISDMAKVGHGGVVVYYIDRDEVTVAEYQAFDSSYTPSEFAASGRMPATNVTYEQANAYCRAKGKRLPTVEEWVGACMGTKGYLYSYGPRYDASRARTGLRWYEGAKPVGAGSTATGEAVDMVGNVWEWADGWYDGARSLRVLRGGAWMDGPDRARCTTETWARPEERRPHVGFRCAVGQD
ncbi:MAG: SUMF1/EgtB/PvdO family nonheme iron enzyme, partial [Candidatus Latescibacteria bacterium]|nr:SUMF1/EgtB/PvdO family nonheme iron enzyme [Candidatus Latescibacterota bacterium]